MKKIFLIVCIFLFGCAFAEKITIPNYRTYQSKQEILQEEIEANLRGIFKDNNGYYKTIVGVSVDYNGNTESEILKSSNNTDFDKTVLSVIPKTFTPNDAKHENRIMSGIMNYNSAAFAIHESKKYEYTFELKNGEINVISSAFGLNKDEKAKMFDQITSAISGVFGAEKYLFARFDIFLLANKNGTILYKDIDCKYQIPLKHLLALLSNLKTLPSFDNLEFDEYAVVITAQLEDGKLTVYNFEPILPSNKIYLEKWEKDCKKLLNANSAIYAIVTKPRNSTGTYRGELFRSGFIESNETMKVAIKINKTGSVTDVSFLKVQNYSEKDKDKIINIIKSIKFAQIPDGSKKEYMTIVHTF